MLLNSRWQLVSVGDGVDAIQPLLLFYEVRNVPVVCEFRVRIFTRVFVYTRRWVCERTRSALVTVA